MTVTLLAHTDNPSKVVASAARLCYSASRADELFDGLDEARTAEFLKKLRDVGHMSPFEHASFTFAVDGLSRVASHQLVRHRIASFSQQSQRYVTMSSSRESVIVPPTVERTPEAAELFAAQGAAAYMAYERLIELGVPKEDARFILPHGWTTSLMITMNARELHHFFSLRLCRRAQWEIRRMASEMLRLVYDAAAELFVIAGPSCLTDGKCREASSCGSPFKNIEELLAGAT
ncbi:flavin-dependent thymidylate synthase [Synergistales bacterium]|nr:flavin-dependent thymidylate synthase [Synergistales bacterium]